MLNWFKSKPVRHPSEARVVELEARIKDVESRCERIETVSDKLKRLELRFVRLQASVSSALRDLYDDEEEVRDDEDYEYLDQLAKRREARNG